HYIDTTYPPCFFFNDAPTANLYPLSLHDALPIWSNGARRCRPNSTNGPKPCHFAKHAFTFKAWCATRCNTNGSTTTTDNFAKWRSEEHTSELQSRGHLVCRLLLEKKKNY